MLRAAGGSALYQGVVPEQCGWIKLLSRSPRPADVKTGQIVDQHAKRPAIADDVVSRDDQQMIDCAQLQDFGSEEWSVLNVEGCLDGALRGRGHGLCLFLSAKGAVIGHSNVQRRIAGDAQLLAVGADGRPQRFMTLDKILQRLAQRVSVQGPRKPERYRFVVGQRSLPTKPVGEPDLALRLRGRNDPR